MADIPRLSYSGMDDYASCQEKFRLRRIVQVPQGSNWAVVGGSAFHTVTERLDLMDFGVPVEGSTDFAEVMEEEIAERLERHPESTPDTWKATGRASKEWPDKWGKDYWLKMGPEWVATYRAWLKTVPWHIWVTPQGDPAVEIELNGMVGGVPVKGFIDRIMEHIPSGKLAIVDLKTSASEPSVSTQLDLYAHLVEQLDICEVDFGFYYMARTGQMTTPQVPADPARLTYLWSQVKKSIDNDLFIPSPSMLCRSCDVVDHCWLMKGRHAAEVQPFAA